jgi:hypothetical protein
MSAPRLLPAVSAKVLNSTEDAHRKSMSMFETGERLRGNPLCEGAVARWWGRPRRLRRPDLTLDRIGRDCPFARLVPDHQRRPPGHRTDRHAPSSVFLVGVDLRCARHRYRLAVATPYRCGAALFQRALDHSFHDRGDCEDHFRAHHQAVSDWGWVLASGIIGIALAVYLWGNLSTVSEWMLGFLLGILLVVEGAALTSLAWRIRREV